MSVCIKTVARTICRWAEFTHSHKRFLLIRPFRSIFTNNEIKLSLMSTMISLFIATTAKSFKQRLQYNGIASELLHLFFIEMFSYSINSLLFRLFSQSPLFHASYQSLLTNQRDIVVQNTYVLHAFNVGEYRILFENEAKKKLLYMIKSFLWMLAFILDHSRVIWTK